MTWRALPVISSTRIFAASAIFIYIIISFVLLGLYLESFEGVAYFGQVFIYVLLFLVLCFVRGGNPIQLDLIFLGFFLVYALATPISYYLIGRERDDVFLNASLLCLTANLGFSIGLLLGECCGYGQAKKQVEVYNLTFRQIKDARRIGYFIFSIGVFLSFFAIWFTVGFEAYFNAGYAGRALIKREAGPIELGLYVAVVGLVLIFSSVLLDENNRKINIIFLLAVSCFFFAYVSFLGVRRPTFLLVISLFAAYCLFVNKLHLITLLLVAVLGFLFFVTFANYRQVISSDGVLHAVEFIGENFSLEWFDFSKTELGAPFKTLVDILSSSDWEHRLMGGSYLESLVYVFPGFINGGLESLSVEYTNYFFSQEFIAIGGNMGFFPVTEALVNFGWFGPLGVFFILGATVVRLNFFLFWGEGNKIFHVVFFSILLPWFAFFMRLDFASFLKGFFYSQFLPLLFAYFLLRLRIRF